MKLKSSHYIIISLGLLLFACNFSNKEKSGKDSSNSINLKPKPPILDPKFVIEKRKISADFYNNILGSERFNGMFLVAKKGKIIYEKYHGYSNFESKKEIDSTTPLHMASISKVATCLAVLRLVDQKKIILDEDVRNFLPEFPYEGISVRMLLNHRSGVPYYVYFTSDIWPANEILSNKDMLLLLKKYKFPLNFKPNSDFEYCNTNFSLLALIIEKVTKKHFPSAMKELIFKPLNMNNTFIFDKSCNTDSVSQSYRSGMVRQKFENLDFVYGDKNMYSTVRDVLKMDNGTYLIDFLSKSSRDEMFKGYSYRYSGTKNYGLGIRMVEEKNKKTYFFHTAWWHGNMGCYATLRGDKVCIVALSNTYDRKVYEINSLAHYFGNYPFEFEEIK
jgi:CubicO group peptidase (beta-lactamase class C family)